MRAFLRIAWVTCVLAVAVMAFGEQPADKKAASPLADHTRFLYSGVKAIVLRAAETMPEEQYGFKPADSVRTFGQIVGHAADAQYTFCSVALGEKNPMPRVEKTKTTKAELIAALKEAFAYCDRGYDPLTDVTAAEMVKGHMGDWPRIGYLNVNNVHTTEHYGNMVTYLRMKGFVPPTSDPEFMKAMMARK